MNKKEKSYLPYDYFTGRRRADKRRKKSHYKVPKKFRHKTKIKKLEIPEKIKHVVMTAPRSGWPKKAKVSK